MIELLLEADRALSGGALDQAERLYWQLLERDSKNAIAITGLAHVSMKRGDTPTARQFVLKALAIDPENPAARRLLAGLDDTAPAETPEELPLAEVEDLEAIGRQRSLEDEEAEPAAAVPEAVELEAEPEAEPETAAVEPEPEGAPVEAPEPVAVEAPAPQVTLKRPARGAPRAPVDPFAAAEALATVEAIDAVDDSIVVPPPTPRPTLRRPERRVRPQPPIATYSPQPVDEPPAETPPGEPAAPQPNEEPGEAEAEAEALAEAQAYAEARFTTGIAMSPPTEPEAQAVESVEVESVEVESVEVVEPSPDAPAAPPATTPAPASARPARPAAQRPAAARRPAPKRKKPGLIRRILGF